MSYQAPYIDASGYHYPTYQEILEDMVERVQSICGTDVYLGTDSMDYQLISIFALKIYDCYQAVELAYNSHSPVTASGTALDYIVALNGISRVQASKSVATVVLTGVPGTVIDNGIVGDTGGVLWDLPESVTIGDDGMAAVTATCRETGTVEAKPDTITKIMTPTINWISVTNPEAATVGTVVESDSALRARQALAVSAPSQSILSGLKAALLEVQDVSRVEVIENDTDSDIADGEIAAHSVCCIVEGGTVTDGGAGWSNDNSIAQTILAHKSMGCGTSGRHTVPITDSTGESYDIKYTRPERVEISIEVTITLLDDSYSMDYYTKTIRTEVSRYISRYSIGKSFAPSMLWGIIQGINEDASNPSFLINNITAQRKDGTGNVNGLIPMKYYEYAYANTSEGAEADIIITTPVK